MAEEAPDVERGTGCVSDSAHVAYIAMILSALYAAALAATASPAALAAAQPVPPHRPEYRTTDLDRLVRDRAYAEELLGSMDSSAFTGQGSEEGNLGFLSTYAAALAGADRADEAKAAIDRLLAAAPHRPLTYYAAWIAALRLSDADRLVAVAEAAARNVPPEGRALLQADVAPETVESLYRYFAERGETAKIERLDEALFLLGWPGLADIWSRDAVRLGAVNRRLRRGEREEAARIADTIDSLVQLVPLLTQRRYDGLLTGEAMQRLRTAIERTDEATRASLASRPRSAHTALRRVEFLRSVGRSEEALAAARPFLADVQATLARYNGNWLINEAAYAMQDLGRDAEAVALMGQIAAIDVQRYPVLASQSINYTAVLRRAGRHQEALAHAERLDAADPPVASVYGRMWLGSAIVCAHADLGRPSEAAAKLAWMREHENENAAALERAYLCLDDMAAAEALVLRRLRGPQANAVVRAFQDLELTPARDRDDPIARRWRDLRERSAVRAALDRVGRVLRLPLAETYWGSY